MSKRCAAMMVTITAAHPGKMMHHKFTKAALFIASEKPENKEDGAEKPECTPKYMRISSTAQRSDWVSEQINRGAYQRTDYLKLRQ